MSAYYQNKISAIDSCIEFIKTRELSNYNKGSISLLIRLRWSMELLLHKAEFGSHDCDDDDDSSNSDFEEDSLIIKF